MSAEDAQEPPDTGTSLAKTVESHESSAEANQETNLKANSSQGTATPGLENVDTYSLLPKLLRTTRILLASKSFFFSYEYDITRRLGSQGNQSMKGSELPLYKTVDPLVRLQSLHIIWS